MSIDNIPKIYELGKKCFDWIFEKVVWNLPLISWYFDNFPDLCFVSVKDGKPVAFVLAFIVDDIGYIGWIAVEKRHRRKGLGTALVRKVTEELSKRKVNLLSSHVRMEKTATSIFEKNKFKKSDEIKIEMVRIITHNKAD